MPTSTRCSTPIGSSTHLNAAPKWFALGALLATLGCASTTPPEAAAPVATPAATPSISSTFTTPEPDDARGGRLFDNFRAEKKLGETFEADSSKTPEVDGKGGPNNNGTLNDGAGNVLPNTGHDYRLKNLFGWDLRGAEGIYGPHYQNKPFVTGRNLLSDTRSPLELREWLRKGDAHVPAYGDVLDDKDLDDLVAFLVKTRERQLAHPDEIFELDANGPKNYRLLAGADVEKGHARYTAACADCHGNDGLALVIDDKHSAGELARTSGFEIWFKLQHGHPGSSMLRQVNEKDGAANSRAVLELLAALCDRSKYPVFAGQTDVSDGDVRCGAYLK